MDAEVERLVKKTWRNFQNLDASRRLLIAISGIPGSGKTTLAASVASGLNRKHHSSYHTSHPNAPEANSDHPDPSQPDIAYVVPLDGYHLTRKQLSLMPNAEEAIFRRGAAFTFDPSSYLALVRQLRQPLEATTPTYHAASFSHSLKDPIPSDIPLPATARIILFEGLYVALNRPTWVTAASLMDSIWYISLSFAIAEARVAKRNFAAGISGNTIEEALDRTRRNDMRNADEIVAEMVAVDEEIKSVEDEGWKSEELKMGEQAHEEQEEESPRLLEERGRMDSIAELAADGAGW